jgi:large conductance mechanosensitive channel
MALVPTKQAFTLLDEFKNFALKGNVIDLAVGVIIGGAFGKIVDSLVKHIFMPSINLLVRAISGKSELKFDDWQWNGILYGNFLTEILNFLIIAAALFLFVVKLLGFIMKMKKTEAAAPAAPPAPTKEQELLTEIRDILKAR